MLLAWSISEEQTTLFSWCSAGFVISNQHLRSSLCSVKHCIRNRKSQVTRQMQQLGFCPHTGVRQSGCEMTVKRTFVHSANKSRQRFSDTNRARPDAKGRCSTNAQTSELLCCAPDWVWRSSFSHCSRSLNSVARRNTLCAAVSIASVHEPHTMPEVPFRRNSDVFQMNFTQFILRRCPSVATSLRVLSFQCSSC